MGELIKRQYITGIGSGIIKKDCTEMMQFELGLQDGQSWNRERRMQGTEVTPANVRSWQRAGMGGT